MDYHRLDVAEEMSYNAVDSIVNPNDLVGRAIKRRTEGQVGIEPPWSKLSGCFAFRPGELVLIGGYSGHRKSSVANQMALHAVDQGYKVGIASLELPAEYVFEQMTGMAAVVREPPEAFMRRFAEATQDRLYVLDHVDTISPMDALKAIIAFRKFLGCDLILVDCLMMVNVGDDLEAEKQFTQKLAAIAKSFNVCIVLVHHMRKSQGKEGEKIVPGKADFIGSSHMINVASSVLIVWTDKELLYAKNSGYEYDESKPDLKIVVAKQRYHEFEGVVGLYTHNNSRVLCNSRARMYRPFNLETHHVETTNGPGVVIPISDGSLAGA